MSFERRYIVEPPESLLVEYGDEILSSPKFLKLKDYRHHVKSNTYDHCVAVTLEAIHLAKKWHIRVNPSALVHGCLLHDYYCYDHHGPDRPKWHWARHDMTAAINAQRDFSVDATEADMIANHMWPIHPLRFPLCIEGWILTLADKVVAAKERFQKKAKKREL